MTGPYLLSTYLRRSGKKQKDVAADAGLKPDLVCSYLSGRRRPGITNAVALFKATGGAVPVESWAQKRKRKAA